ncbi:MAG TPA: glycosyltransferase family 25 protein [Tepidisphaeraceae bacterium]|nr:glycosyltransferase family 25 protein [Tepidisphaeraceae bacterium]
MASLFDRVVVINLARRADRLARFSKRLEGNWPFATPQRFEGVDGLTVSPPATWKESRGAWGCLLSHRAVLESAIADGISSLLVLEDDAYPVDDFPRHAEAFLSRVPQDWHGLMLGAEHLSSPIPVSPGVVECTGAIRCHAYAVREPLLRMLASFWRDDQTHHCDVVFGGLMPYYNVYAPDPLLVGQDAGQSDITPRLEPLRFLSSDLLPQAT